MIKTTLFEFGKKAMFLEFIQHPANGIDVNLVQIFSLDENIIQINYVKDIKLFGQDFIDVALETGSCVWLSK